MEGLECVTENPLSSGASTDTSKGNSPSDKSDRTVSEPKATILGNYLFLKCFRRVSNFLSL